MSWKQDLRLDDLPADAVLEALCRQCGGHVYYTAGVLMQFADFRHDRLDAAEARLRCAKRECGGLVRLYQTDTGETEAFVGGLP